MLLRRALLPALALPLLFGAPAASEERALPAPGSAPWQALAFPKIERHTRYSEAREAGHPVLHAESECSASGLLLPLADVDLTATPRLGWRWRVDQAVAPPDERSRAGDDFAARV